MDAHDLFRKLTSGLKFSKKNLGKPTLPIQKPTTPVKVKQEEDFNAAKEWMNADIASGSEEDIYSDADELSGDGSSEDDESDMTNDGKNADGNLCATKENGSKSFSKKLPVESKLNLKTETDNTSITLLGDMTSNKTEQSVTKKVKKKKKSSPEELLKSKEIEAINLLRKKLRLSVSGDGVPAPIESFDDLKTQFGVSSTLLSNLRNSGYKEPTPIQAQAWPIMLKNRQILACAPTGSGKTAAFLLPILHHMRGLRHDGIRAVIVSPTRELSKQTYRECLRLSSNVGLRVHIISKVNLSNSKLTLEKTNKYDILITTPNRLVFLLKQEPAVLSLRSVQWLIVDESDKLFEAGPRGFRDQLATIYQACDSKNVKRAMFSATHGAHVAKWCKQNLKGLIAVTVGHRNTTADKVDQELVFVGSEQGKLIAMRELISKGLHPPVLIFIQSKERAKELFSELLYDGINVDVIHADRTQLQRDNVVRSFREGKIWVLICTELMGRGIDFKGVNLVINYDFPPSAISYIHRIGRTGRAGRDGKAVTFFTESDAPVLRSIATVMKDSGCDVPQYMLEMKKVSKRARREREKQAPERDSILTIPKSEKQKQERLERKISNAKRKKKGLPPLLDKPSKKRKISTKKEENKKKSKNTGVVNFRENQKIGKDLDKGHSSNKVTTPKKKKRKTDTRA